MQFNTDGSFAKKKMGIEGTMSLVADAGSLVEILNFACPVETSRKDSLVAEAMAAKQAIFELRKRITAWSA